MASQSFTTRYTHELLTRKTRRDARIRSVRRTFVLRLERLEDRLVLSSFTANTLADTVDADPAETRVRDAINAANSQAGDDIINFSVTGTINLTGGQGGAARGGTNSRPLTPQVLTAVVDEAIAEWRAAGSAGNGSAPRGAFVKA